jgi:nitroreductase
MTFARRDLLDIMWQRHTCRAAFDSNRKIREPDLQLILDAARWAPTAHNMQNFEIIAVDDERRLAAIGAIRLRPVETFVREDSRQLSFSEGELLRRRTGLLASMFPESWQEEAAPGEDAGAASLIYLGRTIETCPLLLVVVHDTSVEAPESEGDLLGLMSLGCVMQNLWLSAENVGISMQVLSGLGAEDVEPQVQSILSIPPHLKIGFAARLGYPLAPPQSHLRVRRKIQDFMHRNRYRVREERS